MTSTPKILARFLLTVTQDVIQPDEKGVQFGGAATDGRNNIMQNVPRFVVWTHPNADRTVHPVG